MSHISALESIRLRAAAAPLARALASASPSADAVAGQLATLRVLPGGPAAPHALHSRLRPPAEPRCRPRRRRRTPCATCTLSPALCALLPQGSATPGHAVRPANPALTARPLRSDKVSSALYFKYNTQLGPPYTVLLDTNFINFSIRNKVCGGRPRAPEQLRRLQLTSPFAD